MSRAALTLLFFLCAVLDGCSCHKKTDEELLKERVDAMPVHLWLSAKIALGTDDTNKDVKTARKLLLQVIDAAAKKDGKNVELGPKEAASLALALWELRGLGKDAFKKNRTDVPKLVLPQWVKAGPELDEILDANLEHALFFLGLTVAKMHPDYGLPIPPEILLYEAWWSDVDSMKVKSLGPVVRGFKAYIYGTSELCDLANRDAKKIDAGDLDADSLAADAKLFGAKDVQVSKKEAREANAAIAVLANGATAICYMQRNEPQKANAPMHRMLDEADELGMTGPEVEFLRGYVECADGDEKTGRRALQTILDDDKTPKPRKEAAKAILAACGKHGGVLGGVTERVVLGTVIGLLAYEYLDRAGLIDDLKDTSAARSIRGLVTGVSSALDKGRSAIPSLGDAEEKAKEKAKGWWPF
ncbi:MAG: hypothetical protein ACXWUG_26790 [Polyangiales bacterium]